MPGSARIFRPVISAVAILGVLVACALAPAPAPASAPANATVSYAHPIQVFHQSHTMQGGARAGFVQTICTTQPDACDPVHFTVDPTVNGTIDHGAVVTVVFEHSSPDQMTLAQYPKGCPEDSDPTGRCATYGPPLSYTDPGKADFRWKVVCQACVAGTYTLTVTLKHDATPRLPATGNTAPGFVVTPLPDPKAEPGYAGVGVGQLTTQFGEPGIAMNQNGYGIVNTFGPTVWITHDSGKTWSSAKDVFGNDLYCQDGYAADADGAVGIDNTFYADNLCVGTVGGVSNESFTNTAGGDPAQWGSPHLAGGNSDRQWYATDPKDPKTLYFSYHAFGGPNIDLFKSTDGGTTFFCPATGVPVTPATSGIDCPVTATSAGTPPINTTYLDTGLGNVTTRPLVDPTDTNTIYVPYADSIAQHAVSASPGRTDNDLTRFRMAVSRDGGKTWAANTDETGQGSVFDSEDGKYFPVTNTDPLDGTDDSTVAHIFIGAAIDSGGNLYILFSFRLGKTTPTHLYMMSSTDHGKTWSKPHRVDPDGLNSNVFPAIVAGDAGRIAMSWYGSRANDFNDTGSKWSEMYAESVNALSANPDFAASRVSAPDQPVHAADICQAGLGCSVTGGNRDLADFQSITVDPCGHAVMVYTDDHTPTAHTVIGRATAGNSLYASTPASCAGPSASHPVSTKKPSTSVLGTHKSRGALPATGSEDHTPIAAVLILAIAAFLGRRLALR